MTNTGYDHNGSVIKKRASGYARYGTTLQNATYADMSVPFAAGALYSTVEDLYLWDQALYTEKLLPKKYMDMLFARHIPAFDEHYGYGWQMGSIPLGKSDERVETIGHGGAINGFNTQITRIPADKSTIILLSNAGGAPLMEMTINIAGVLYDKPYNLPKKSIAFSLMEVIEKDGIATALAYYKTVKDSSNYRLNEYEMNAVGYQLLQSSRAKEAAAVFKLNVEAFPQSSNAYDSYGEALLAMGDTAASIENYTKSVKLNPGNQGGLKVLETLGVNTDAFVYKISIEQLKKLEGEYLIMNPPSENEKMWKIEFKIVNGDLMGNDRGYRYKLVPVGENAFINPDDGASIQFDTKNKNAMTVTLFGKVTFKKLN
jgi:tetratricopeptide (TPR) repeat protein